MTDPEAQVDEIVDRWEELRYQGTTATPEELCRDCPELLAAVKEQIERLTALDDFLGRRAQAQDPLLVVQAALKDARYRPIRFHAKGGLGEVYVALDQELAREVALKRMQSGWFAGQPERDRFVLEAEITGVLEHPGIVPVYGMGKDHTGQPYYAMRLIRGHDLAEALRQLHQTNAPCNDPGERLLGLQKLLRSFLSVCQTIAYAHSRGIIHRDIKPTNIMVGNFGETLVVDWGLAKAFNAVEESGADAPTPAPAGRALLLDLTQPGVVKGTAAFMSPEQAKGLPDRVGPASDIYSLGATLYALLTGRPPFAGRHLVEVLETVKAGRFPAPRQVNKDVPRALEAICLKAMRHDPAARYGSALDLAADVEHWQADEPVAAYREPLRVRFGRWRRKHRPLVAALSAALLVVLVGAGAFGWWYQQEQARQAVQEAKREQERAVRLAKVEHDSSKMVERVQQLRAEARTAPAGDLHKWTEALALAKQAEGRLVSAEVDERLRQRVNALVAELEQEASARSTLFRLEEARLQLSDVDAKGFQFQAADDAFARAFREYGINMDTLPGAEAEARIRVSPIKEQLVAALDWWNFAQRGNKKPDKDWRHLVQVARSVDPDPLRNLLRDLWTKEGPREEVDRKLKSLAANEEVFSRPASDLILLGLILSPPSEIDLLQKAQERYPDNFWINFRLGELFYNRKPAGLDAAIRYWTAAVALRSQNPMIHAALGNALYHKGNLDGAVAAYRHSFRLNKNDPKMRQALASFLVGKAEALGKKGDLDGAIAACREAIQVREDNDLAHLLLGLALADKEQLDEAVISFKEAIRLKKDAFPAHVSLGQAFLEQGRFGDALDTLQRALALFSQDPHSVPEFKDAVTQKIKVYNEFLAADKQLPAILSGRTKVSEAEDHLFLAELCRYKRLYGPSASFYGKAFQAQPNLADQLKLQDRYHAARAAALAGSGQGEDAAKLSEQTRAKASGKKKCTHINPTR